MKKVKVTFVRFEGADWELNVATRNATQAIIQAYKHYVREGLSVEDIEDIKTSKSDSYL